MRLAFGFMTDLSGLFLGEQGEKTGAVLENKVRILTDPNKAEVKNSPM